MCKKGLHEKKKMHVSAQPGSYLEDISKDISKGAAVSTYMAAVQGL